MQQYLDTLADILAKADLTIGQKRTAANIINKLVNKLFLTESLLEKRIKKDHKIKSDFADYYDKIHVIIRLLNIPEVDKLSLNYKYCNWLSEHLDEVKADLTYIGLMQLLYYIEMFENCNEKMPFDMVELKAFILEPLEIKVDYETDFSEALIHFRKTGEKLPILKYGFFKEIQKEAKNG